MGPLPSMVAIAVGLGSFVAGGATAAAFFQRKLTALHKELSTKGAEEHLHWDENREIRGLGDLLHKAGQIIPSSRELA